MKPLLSLILLTFIFTSGCKKAIEKEKERQLMAAITDGVWFIEQFKEKNTDITASFSDYSFRFYEDGKVEGIRTGQPTETGTWKGDLLSKTIDAQFAQAGDPLNKVNGIWKITDSYSNYVEANMPVTGGKNILHLRKRE
ncbi:hypothetical protein HHL16_07180 [Pseudoflavitalea sp. G-6-1-2]|uniref:hypothetical protein n=1 Tax=Pseudoflavitalea sp. G-6-1-2 TaxID=2728841 RepID=UPI00146E959C|nr:hypothetical protein [Pseudoflavitalea sp. G-6-1-2]NML20650.1 hypothetical protein [Pseudoflavitalea sp. G-6-1-2]